MQPPLIKQLVIKVPKLLSVKYVNRSPINWPAFIKRPQPPFGHPDEISKFFTHSFGFVLEKAEKFEIGNDYS